MDSFSKLIRSRRSLELELPPSCVEFCPAHPSYFLVGTYSLQPENSGPVSEDAGADLGTGNEESQPAQPKQPQSRNGSVVAFQLMDGEIIHIQTEPQPSALLDLRFNPNDGSRDICAVVSSTATLTLFKLRPDSGPPLKHLATMDIAVMSEGVISVPRGTEILFLSFCWHPSQPDMAAITTSTGHVYFVHLPGIDGNWELHPEPIITHLLETWTVAISPIPIISAQSSGQHEADEVAFRVYSGGDDSMLRFRTCNWSGATLTEPLPALELRGHDAGVTAILPLFELENGHEIVVTGSYDERIRLFSVPSFGKARNLAESSLGGGVWRLKLIDLDRSPQRDYSWRARILASCMHAGARVVELVETAASEYQFRVLGRFEEHKSMNYGSDFQPTWKDKLSVVSTSFYDKLLCFWELDMS
ncbi:methylated diphthine methylhydrolase [Madurella fahalii]|uniref:Methylated diphthine methylhydrolase n=1 Tax=Madurella fahalii TaxID=1157608 RepID=A0ABQ0GHR0_9PEZI